LPTWIETLLESLIGGLGQLVANGAAGVGECFEKVLASGHWRHRKVTVETLARFAGVEGVRRLLLGRLEDWDSNVVAAALVALSSQVGTVEEVYRAAKERLEDKREQVCASAVIALTGIVESDTEVREAILERLGEGYTFRQAAVSALAGMAKTNKEVRRALLAKLDDSNWLAQRAAIELLAGGVGEDDNVRQAVLAKLDDPDVADIVINALSGVVGSDKEVRRALLVKLDGPSASDAMKALSGLVGSDEEVRAAALTKLADFWVAQAAISALSSLVGSDEEVRLALCEKAKKGREPEQISALQSLSGLLSSHEEVNSVFRAQSNAAAWGVRKSVVEALGENAGTVESLAVMEQHRENRNTSESLAVWKALASGAPQGLTGRERWRNFWLEKMNSESLNERSGAIHALQDQIEIDSDLRRSVLRRLDDESSEVQASALRALSGVVSH
jgi:hypothetical protein